MCAFSARDVTTFLISYSTTAWAGSFITSDSGPTELASAVVAKLTEASARATAHAADAASTATHSQFLHVRPTQHQQPPYNQPRHAGHFLFLGAKTTSERRARPLAQPVARPAPAHARVGHSPHRSRHPDARQPGRVTRPGDGRASLRCTVTSPGGNPPLR